MSKLIQRSFLAKITTNDNCYRANKFSNYLGVFLTIMMLTIVCSAKLAGRPDGIAHC